MAGGHDGHAAGAGGAAAAQAAEAAPAPHAHGSPHGGTVETAGPYHYELLVRGNTIVVYLLDGELATLPPSDVTGDVAVVVGGSARTLPLVPVGDHFEAPADGVQAAGLVAVVRLRVDGTSRSVRIVYAPAAAGGGGASHGAGHGAGHEAGHAAGHDAGGHAHAAGDAPHAHAAGDAPHADHAARHGGLLLMYGDHHFEVVLDRGGQHRVYMSDAVRNPARPERFPGSTLTVDRDDGRPERLPLAPAGDHLAAKGLPVAGAATARVELNFGEPKPYFIDVPFPAPAAPPK